MRERFYNILTILGIVVALGLVILGNAVKQLPPASPGPRERIAALEARVTELELQLTQQVKASNQQIVGAVQLCEATLSKLNELSASNEMMRKLMHGVINNEVQRRAEAEKKP